MIEQTNGFNEKNIEISEKNAEIDDFYEESVEKTKNIINEAISKGYTIGDDDLFWGDIGAEGAKALAESENLKNLTTLNLHLNNIGAEGAKALAESENLKNLTTLDLGHNNIGAEGAKALAESENLKNITSLNFWGNGISAGTRKILDDAFGSNRHARQTKGHTQESKLLPVIGPSILAITTGIAIAVYLEMLAVGIAVGVCCLIAATIIYRCRPKSSIENSNVEKSFGVEKEENVEITCLSS